MTATITHINGHDPMHQLQQLRQARAQVASALMLAGQYLELAHKVSAVNALPYDIPSGKAIAETLDTINRELNGNAPRQA
jgi:hypothetical protein